MAKEGSLAGAAWTSEAASTDPGPEAKAGPRHPLGLAWELVAPGLLYIKVTRKEQPSLPAQGFKAKVQELL